MSSKSGESAMLRALCGDDVSDGAGAAALRALGLPNNAAEKSSPSVMGVMDILVEGEAKLWGDRVKKGNC